MINAAPGDQPEVGYLLRSLNTISKSERRLGTRAIVLGDSNARVHAIADWVDQVGKQASIAAARFTDEQDDKEQMNILAAGPLIIVATPQQLAKVLEQGRAVFREVEHLIIDQADAVTDWAAADVISRRVINKCQRIFVASKDSKELRDAESKMLTEPELVRLAPPKQEKEKVADPVVPKDLTQYYINVPPRSKISTLMAYLNNEKSDRVVIFTASRKTADRLYKVLRKNGRRAVSVHDQVDKKTYDERMDMFLKNNVQHAIIGEQSAGDVPIQNAELVINYDVPEEVDEYKLRAELVGDGKAVKIISLVSQQDRSDIKTICTQLGYAPEEVPLPKQVAEKKDRKKQKPGPHKSKSKPKRSSSKKRPKSTENGHKYKGLPRPTYDGLPGGRTGKQKEDEPKGIVGFFKKLFS